MFLNPWVATDDGAPAPRVEAGTAAFLLRAVTASRKAVADPAPLDTRSAPT